MMAALTALLCLRTARAAERLVPGWAGPAAAVLLLTMPPVLVHSRLVMAEILLSWLCLETVVAFAGWMDAPGWRRAGAFAFWATAACLTKVTAVWLAPMAIVGIVFSGRWKLLGEKSMWCAGLLAAILTVPWYLYAPGALHQASPDRTGVFQLTDAVTSTRLLVRPMAALRLFPILAGWMGPMFFMALWGWRQLWRRGAAIAPVAAASVVGMMMIRYLVLATAYEDRTAMPLVAPLVICAAAAMPGLMRFPAAASAALVAFALWSVLTTPPKHGYDVEAAKRTCKLPEYRDAVLLVAADFNREGAFVAGMALGERRPNQMVLRASKVLARSTWTGHRYDLMVHNGPETMAMIERIPVGLLIMDSDPRRWSLPHMRLLAETIAANPRLFRRVGGGGALLVYEVAGFRDRPRGPVTIYMYGLGRSIGSGAQ